MSQMSELSSKRASKAAFQIQIEPIKDVKPEKIQDKSNSKSDSDEGGDENKELNELNPK